MDAGPDLLAGEFTSHWLVLTLLQLQHRGKDNALVLPDSIVQPIESIRHDHVHSKQVVNGTETAGGQVPLRRALVHTRILAHDQLLLGFLGSKRTLYWTG